MPLSLRIFLGGVQGLVALEDEGIGLVTVEGELDKFAGGVADHLDQVREVADADAVNFSDCGGV